MTTLFLWNLRYIFNFSVLFWLFVQLLIWPLFYYFPFGQDSFKWEIHSFKRFSLLKIFFLTHCTKNSFLRHLSNMSTQYLQIFQTLITHMIVLTRANGSKCPMHLKCQIGQNWKVHSLALQAVPGVCTRKQYDTVWQASYANTHATALKMDIEGCHFAVLCKPPFSDAFHNHNAY